MAEATKVTWLQSSTSVSSSKFTWLTASTVPGNASLAGTLRKLSVSNHVSIRARERVREWVCMCVRVEGREPKTEEGVCVTECSQNYSSSA